MMLDRLKQQIVDLVEALVGRRLLFSFLWEGSIITFSGGLAEVVIDDARMKGTGMSRITLRNGMPGVTSTLKAGDRVIIGFSGGDPDKPFILAHGEATAATERIARENDRVDIGEFQVLSSGGFVTAVQHRLPPAVIWTNLTPAGTQVYGRIDEGSDRASLED